jgi:hypothetical protein
MLDAVRMGAETPALRKPVSRPERTIGAPVDKAPVDNAPVDNAPRHVIDPLLK